MRTKLKLVLVLASLGATAALTMAGPAAAGEIRSSFAAGDPMTTNIPYVAWAGEEVRLVKCIDDDEGEWEGTEAEWAILDSSVRQRSGELRDPVFFDNADRRTARLRGWRRASRPHLLGDRRRLRQSRHDPDQDGRGRSERDRAAPCSSTTSSSSGSR